MADEEKNIDEVEKGFGTGLRAQLERRLEALEQVEPSPATPAGVGPLLTGQNGEAAEARNRRQATAEERAMKAPIKMLFPTVIFIFPAMFIVILGPAFLNLSKIF